MGAGATSGAAGALSPFAPDGVGIASAFATSGESAPPSTAHSRFRFRWARSTNLAASSRRTRRKWPRCAASTARDRAEIGSHGAGRTRPEDPDHAGPEWRDAGERRAMKPPLDGRWRPLPADEKVPAEVPARLGCADDPGRGRAAP